MKKLIYTLSLLAIAVYSVKVRNKPFTPTIRCSNNWSVQVIPVLLVKQSWSAGQCAQQLDGFPRAAPIPTPCCTQHPSATNWLWAEVFFQSKFGRARTSKLQANYAFRFQIQKAKIGLGLSTDFSSIAVWIAAYWAIPTSKKGDPTLEIVVDGTRIFDASVGAHVLYDESFDQPCTAQYCASSFGRSACKSAG